MKLAQQVIAHSLHQSTRSSYRSAIHHIELFHKTLGVHFSFPVSPDTLCLWMADSANKLRFPSIRVYMHAIATTQVELGYPSPLLQSPLVWRMFKSIKRLQGQPTVRTRLPITVAILARIDEAMDKHKMNDPVHLCMRAAMWLGTTGLLRAGEFTRKLGGTPAPQLQHLTFHTERGTEAPINSVDNGTNKPAYMSLKLIASKTDPFRHGTSVVVSHPRAIKHMLTYLRQRNQTLARLPLLCGTDGQPLSASALVQFTQQMISVAQIPNAHLFLGHSFRKGGATSLHEAGHPDSLIKAMGRWASFAFATYIQTPLTMLIAAGRSLEKVEHSSTELPSSFWETMDSP